jgi:hypothetical protein
MPSTTLCRGVQGKQGGMPVPVPQLHRSQLGRVSPAFEWPAAPASPITSPYFTLLCCCCLPARLPAWVQ